MSAFGVSPLRRVSLDISLSDPAMVAGMQQRAIAQKMKELKRSRLDMGSVQCAGTEARECKNRISANKRYCLGCYRIAMEAAHHKKNNPEPASVS